MLIQTDALTKRYGQFTALNQCSLAVKQGEVLGLLGPNGAGKTTLLRLLMGNLKPSAGTATIDSLDCYRQSVQVHRLVSYLPGDARTYRAMRGRDVLRFFADMHPLGNRQRAFDNAERLALDTSRRVGFMSTGMRQKLALAMVFANATPLIILDEPTSHLDPSVRSEVTRMVRSAQQQGRTVLFSSHILPEVDEVSDRVAILRQGELVHLQAMNQLRQQNRIEAWLTDKLPPVPDLLKERARFQTEPSGQITIDTDGELAPWLGWLATAPLQQIRIQPVGLRAVYDRFHGNQAAEGDAEHAESEDRRGMSSPPGSSSDSSSPVCSSTESAQRKDAQ